MEYLIRERPRFFQDCMIGSRAVIRAKKPVWQKIIGGNPSSIV
jgi:hypothetical protein